jgi:hypothetical protein
MIVFGLAEIVTAFTHRFFGVSIAHVTLATYTGFAIGVLYAAAGLLILTMKKWAAALAIVLLIVDIVGRVWMTVTGLYPVDTLRQALAIVFGTLIVAGFAVYIGLRWSFFR